MKQTVLTICTTLLLACWMQSWADTQAIISWSKTFPSVCFFAAAKGDTVIAVTDRITVFSSSGDILSQTERIADLQNLENSQYAFAYLNDKTLLLLKNRYIIIKLNLSGEVLWSQSLRDTVPNAVCSDFTEDSENNLYFCGDISYESAFLAKISQNGELLLCVQESSFGSFHSIALSSQTIYLSTSAPSTYWPSLVVNFDTEGNFINTVTDNCNGTVLAIKDNHIFSLGYQDGGSLFKAKFFATRDILLKKLSLDGRLVDSVLFDFGKYENPMELVEQNDGLVMITASDETVNMGTSIMNYFITKLNSDLQQEWQLSFGTDTSGLMGEEQIRSFSANKAGTILAGHNDTLTCFAVPSSELRRPPSPTIVIQTKDLRIYDLRGRLLNFKGNSPQPVQTSGILVNGSKTAAGQRTILSVKK